MAARAAEVATHAGKQAAFAEQIGHQGQRLRGHQYLLEHLVVVKQVGNVGHPLDVFAGGGLFIHLAPGLALEAV